MQQRRVTERDAREALPTGVVTFLLSDVEGSTRMWEADEGDAAAAIARHYELLDAAIVLHGGVRPAEQGEGDSVVGAFARPSDAVAAALAAQRAFAEEPWPSGREVRVRIALHAGEAQLRDPENYAGRTVIRCARLRAIAHGGQTVVSAATRDLVGDRLPEGASLRDLGSHRLKDLAAAERVWQLCHPDLREDFPPLRSLDAMVNNLPAQLTSFVGREDQIAGLRPVLAEGRLVTLTGTGGAGKTRLAAHVVADVADRHNDGVWWVELAPLTDPELLPFAVARGLGVQLEGTRPPVDALCERVAGLEVLLALDNCEHLVDACARLVDRLLAAAPRLRVVTTSREPLGVGGEVVWRVPPLDTDAAARLFVDRAVQVRPGFAPDEAEASSIAAVCRRLDGIPLAIELAAARVRMMSPADIATALDDRFRLLTGGGRTALPRQQTLETSVAWSHDLLDERERALLRRLSAFAGGFTLAAAEAVCAAEPLDRYAVLDLISRLVDKSLVNVEHGASGYRLLETVRLYAAQRLIEAGEADATRDRHLAFHLDLAERARPEAVRAAGGTGGPGQDATLAVLSADIDNLQAAYVWGLTSGQNEAALRIATALFPLWRMRGRRLEGSTWLDEALSAGGEVGPQHRLAALIARSRLPYGDSAAGADVVDEAVRLARQYGDRRLLARALIGGVCYTKRGPAAWRANLLEAAGLAEELADPEVLVDARLRLSLVAFIEGDPVEMARLAQVAQALARVHGDTYGVRQLAVFQAIALLMQGAARPALELLVPASTEASALGDRAVAQYSLACEGWAYELVGARDAAVRASDAAVAMAGKGERAHDAMERLGWGMAALVRGAAREAAAALAEGRHLVDEAPGFSDIFAGPQAEAELAQGGTGRARDLADGVLARHRELRLPWAAGWAFQARARVALSDGQSVRAEDLAHEALAVRLGIEDLAGVADSLEFLAGLAAAQESREEAVRLLGAAAAARAVRGCRRPGIFSAVEALTSGLRTHLGGAAFDAAWAQGAALDAAAAVAYASRGRGERGRPSAGWAALTPAEREVSRLVAEGLRNKEIADRLFVSPRTVQAHLSNIFVKLDIGSRVQLAQEFVRRAADAS